MVIAMVTYIDIVTYIDVVRLLIGSWYNVLLFILGTTFSDAFKKDIGTAKGLENFALGEMLVLPQTFGLVFHIYTIQEICSSNAT